MQTVIVNSEAQPMLFEACTKTVSLLYSMIFGAGDACIDMSATSILAAFAVFMLLVIAAQFVARRIWARLMQGPADAADKEAAISERRIGQVSDEDGPVKTSRF